MTGQFPRKASLIVASTTQVLDMSELQFRFEINQGDVQTPNAASIVIYNVSRETADKVQKEFSRVILQAGYEGSNYGVIFDGTIKQVRQGRDSAVDTYLAILAADADKAYNFGVVNTTLSAGATPEDQFNALAGSMAEHGVTPGYTDQSTGGVLPRGKVLYGMAKDGMRTLASSQNKIWSIQNGKLQMISQTGYAPGDVVELTAATGMIGFPEQTNQGITVRTLLNPLLKIGGRVRINNKSIQQAQFNLDVQNLAENYLLATIADDGLYRVYVVDQVGDTRGNDWYSDLVCLSINSSAPPAQAVKMFG